MKRTALILVTVWLGFGAVAHAGEPGATPAKPEVQLLAEQKHFFECLAYVYRPELWISYRGNLYFAPKTEEQFRKIQAMLADRAAYVALTNRETRHALAHAGIARSGIGEPWQRKLLLPVSETNFNLTPTLDRPLQVIPEYKVLQSVGGGDVFIEQSNAVYFVMEAERGIGEKFGKDACLIREGTKTYHSAEGQTNRVEAFTSVGLNSEEAAVLEKVAASFQRTAAALKPPPAERPPPRPLVAESKSAVDAAQQEFQLLLARANDSNPYMQYLVARSYLEGKGTARNEQLGLEWMKRAAKNGSGDAAKYLEKSGPKPR